MSLTENPAEQHVMWDVDRLAIAMKITELVIEPPMTINEQTAIIGMLNGRPTVNPAEQDLRYAIATSPTRVKGGGMITRQAMQDHEPRLYSLYEIKRTLTNQATAITHQERWRPIYPNPAAEA